MRIVPLMALAAVLLAGCASYVNIPPMEGDTAFHDPNTKVVRSVMGGALAYVMEQRPIERSYQVILPVGTTPMTYAELLSRLGDNAMWSSDGVTKDVPIVAVSQVRVRGTSAEVDVVRPTFSNDLKQSGQTVTVSLKYDPMGGWVANHIKEWRGDVSNTANPLRAARQQGL